MLSDWYRYQDVSSDDLRVFVPPAGSPQNLCFLNMVFDQPCDPFAVEVPIKVKHTVTRTKTDTEVCVRLCVCVLGECTPDLRAC